MGAAEEERFLSDLAVARHVAASTQNQAFNALMFLYRDVLHQEWGELGEIERANRPERLSAVLTRGEVDREWGWQYDFPAASLLVALAAAE